MLLETHKAPSKDLKWARLSIACSCGAFSAQPHVAVPTKQGWEDGVLSSETLVLCCILMLCSASWPCGLDYSQTTLNMPDLIQLAILVVLFCA